MSNCSIIINKYLNRFSFLKISEKCFSCINSLLESNTKVCMGRSTPCGQNFCLKSSIKAINYPEITIPKNTINRNKQKLL